MGFRISERHYAEFHSQGFTVFRGILPTSLIADMRRACEPGAAQARGKQGANAQRFQPVSAYDVDQRPFEDFRELPPLLDAIRAILTPRHLISQRSFMGVLVEPTASPYALDWHRDYLRPWLSAELRADVMAKLADLDYFNQSNCALYEDSSLWLVPGSQHRAGHPHELRVAEDGLRLGDRIKGRTHEEIERICLEYVGGMPGAVQVHLGVGDFALYRQNLWHTGNYVTYRRRATMHNHVDTPEFVAWMHQWVWGPPKPVEDPYAHTLTRKPATALQETIA
jgi:ectoine hydroxylase-related dioxygenase (phytanoyl-CoA dioxygenase family)